MEKSSSTFQLLDGKLVSKKVKKILKKSVRRLKEMGITPHLCVIQVGDDPSSKTYIRNKQKACEKVGIASTLFHYPKIEESELLKKIHELNNDSSVNGILVQLPLPSYISTSKVINAIAPEKDVDGLHPLNLGKLVSGDDSLLPCTPAGIIEMLKFYNIKLEGKNACVIGRSNIVGKPLAHLLLRENATVTMCHSKTKNLEFFTKNADILIAAIGKPKFVKANFVKTGAVVIDVGINVDSSGQLCGDVDFQEVSKKAAFITPVPGGVGPMTVTMLLKNTVIATLTQNNLKTNI